MTVSFSSVVRLAALTVGLAGVAQAQDAMPSLGNRFAPVCIEPIVGAPGFAAQVDANTRRLDPAFYNRLAASSLQKTAADPKLGDVRLFNGYDYLSNDVRPVSAKLMAVGTLSYLWVEESELISGNVTQADVDAMFNALEVQAPATAKDPTKSILALDQQYFGNPPNRDGDGKLDVLIYDIKDGWKPGYGFVAGLFNPADQVAKSQFPSSNERDLIYIDTYPSITSPSRHSTSVVLQTLAHEYQHLIHYNYDRNESTFINEGLSEYAEGICGYALREPDDYLNKPNLYLLNWGTGISDEVLADYARASLWTSYVFDQLGDDQIKYLVQNKAVGEKAIDSLVARSRSALSVADLTHRFHVANWVNDRSIGTVYGYGNVQRATVKIPASVGIDLALTTGSQARTVEGGGVEYLRFKNVPSLYTRFKGTNYTGALRVSAVYTEGGVKKVIPVAENTYFGLPVKADGSLYPEVSFVVSSAAINKFSSQLKYTIERVNQPAGVLLARPKVSLGVLRNSLVPEAFDLALLPDKPINVGSSTVTMVSPTGTMLGSLPVRASAGAPTSLYLADARRSVSADGTYGVRLITAYVNGIVTLDTLYQNAIAVAHVQSGAAVTATLGGEARVTLPAGAADAGAVIVSRANPVLDADLIGGYRTVWTGGALRRPAEVTLALPADAATSLTLARWTGSSWVAVPGATVDLAARTVTGQVSDLTAFKLADLSTLAVDEPTAPAAFRLLPAAPNPFNPTTTLRYQTATAGTVRLDVYDALGRRIATLVNEPQSAGQHTVTFDASGLPSGFYLARLSAGGAVRTQKLTLTK